MGQIVFIGVGAGAAAALLFASVASGSPVSLPLAQLAPLPILIAALGWSHWAGLVAAASAAAGLGSILGFRFFPAFLFAVGLPAWWLGYLALLARPSSNGAVAGLEWYPVGRLLFWSAVIASVLTVGVFAMNFGTDKEALQAGLRNFFEQVVRLQASGSAGGNAIERPETRRMIEMMATAALPAAAVFTTIINAVNLWLAARVVHVSGRLRRPWPDLSAISLPPITIWLLAAALAGTFLPGFIGLTAGALAATLIVANAIVGFAVLHVITRGIALRGLALGIAYVSIPLGWPVLAVSLLGLAEMALNIRDRFAQKGGPPAART
jgi:hypothetical protein